MLSFYVKFVQTDRQTTAKQSAPNLLIRGHKNKNFTENSKSKEGPNSCKTEFRVITLVCTYPLFYSEHIF